MYLHTVVTVVIFMLLLVVIIGLCYRNYNFLQIVVGGRKESRVTGQMRTVRTKDLQKYPRSRSEADIIKHLEDITGKKFPTSCPKWLVWKGKSLELDGYNETLKIALEFSGPMHTKWSPEKETYPEYFERVVRDIVKKKICKRHGVNLIVVDMSLPPRHWRVYLESRLFDIGFIEFKPAGFIDPQIAAPFRNTQLEQELGLEAEMRAVNRL